MTGVADNVLVVENDPTWADTYVRAINRTGSWVVRIARSLDEARVALQDMSFGMALIDLELDDGAKNNQDGLLVMKEVRRSDPNTSIVMITGVGTLENTRDAMKKFGAFDALSKTKLDPEQFEDLLLRATEAFRATSTRGWKAWDVLRGDLEPWDWEDQVIRSTRVRGGVDTLRSFLDGLFLDFLPVRCRYKGQHVQVDSSGLCYGEYWSRGKGKAVIVAFGESRDISAGFDGASFSTGTLSQYVLQDIERDYSLSNLRGVVVSIPRGSTEFVQ